ncbi:hypothetical protein IWQ56_000996 [Coemansia nantahalensis]|nr:hypothetical protein IWQ56_000996 [Coemansia nantahalensis]
MPHSDSDSDDFFSDLRAFRSTLGLPHKQRSAGSSTPEGDSKSNAAPGSGSDDDGVQSARREDDVGARASASPSPRNIPLRTPESRLASPLAILQRPRKPPATPSPAARRQQGSPGVLTAPAAASPLSVRSLWDRADASPATTPARRPRLASLLDASRHTPGAPAGGLACGAGSARLGATADHSGLLGRVEEALVTEDDIDAAKRKIGQEQTLTQQQMLREIRERLAAYAGSVDEAAIIQPWVDSATLLSQFHTFGHGRLSYTAREIVWRGDMLGPLATLAQCVDGGRHAGADGVTATDTTLVFPWARVSGVRAKSVDDASLLMATVDEDLGIAFQVAHWGTTAGGAVDLANDMNHQLRRALAARSPQAEDRGAPGAEPGDLPEPAPMRDLVCALLRVATSLDVQHAGLDIPRAMGDEDFVARAASMVASLGLQLAQEAQQVCGSPLGGASDAAGHSAPPKLCTLCYAENESVELTPCGHRLCGECLDHLLRLYPTSSQKTDDPAVACACPWDRSHISSWSNI